MGRFDRRNGWRTALLVAAVLGLASSARAGDAEVAKALEALGGKVETDQDGVVRSVFFRDSSVLKPEHWRAIGQRSSAA